MTSQLFKLSLRDLFKGAVTAVLAAIMTTLVQMINSGSFSLTIDNLKAILSVAIVTLLSYLTKNLLTDENGKLGGKF